MNFKKIGNEYVKKILITSISTVILSQSSSLCIFANEENNLDNKIFLNKENESTLEKDVKNSQNIPNFNITTNITDEPFGINGNFTMTFKMNCDPKTNKTIKKGDKIKVKLPPGAITKFVLDVSDIPTLKLNFNNETSELIIEFTENIICKGSSTFRINFVVGDKKVFNYTVNTYFEREGNITPLQISNSDIFNSSGKYISNYKFLSPYWNTKAPNYIGEDSDIGLFLNTINRASFYVDVNSGFNYTTNNNSFEVSIETIDNIELIKDSIKVICYYGENDKIGTQVSKENLKWLPQLQSGVHRLQIKENYTGKRYRIFFDGLVKNIQDTFIVQFYSNYDTYYPFLKSKMTDKISNNNYIPIIFGPTNETIKLGSNFNPKRGMSAYDEEDGHITDKIKVIENTVNISKAGTYTVKYEVTDTSGNTTQLTKTVIVINNTPPILNGVKDKTITIGQKFNPLDGVSATDKEDGNIPLTKDNIVKNTVDTNKVGTYEVTYKVTDKNDAVTTKTIKITVINKDVKPSTTFKTENNNKSNYNNPKTGDSSILVYTGLWLASVSGIFLNRKKR